MWWGFVGCRVADLYDQATEREEHDRELAIAAARRPVAKLPAVTGECLNCGDDIAAADAAGEAIADRWCCIECQEDWTARLARKGS